MARLLIVDDGKNIRRHLATFFEGRGHEVRTADSAQQALSLMSGESDFELILTDYRMAEMNGIELLSEVKRRNPNIAVILMTAFATVQNAVAAMKAGAHDYLTKPFSLERISYVVDRALEVQRLRAENRALRDSIDQRPLLDSQNQGMRQLLRSAQQFAITEVPILLVGESGTGKKVLARQIHRWSNRCDQPFVVADCEIVQEELLEGELFGSVRKALDGRITERPGRLDAANTGTILLQKIGNMSLPLQRKLLQFIKSSTFERSGGTDPCPVDIRIIADVNDDLTAEVAEKRFREDLFHRLNVATLHVPPLRERSEDILPMAEHLLSTAVLRSDRRRRLSFSQEAAAAIIRYRWPGNISELRNAMERAAILALKGVVTPEHLPDAVLRDSSEKDAEALLTTTMEELEREHILRVMAASQSIEEAAEKLGINSATLWRKRKRYRIG